MHLFLPLSVILAFTPPASDAVDKCKESLLQHPNNYEEIICLHRLPLKHAVELLDEAERRAPEGLYFDLLRGNLNWRANPKQAPHDYRKAARKLLATGHDLGAVLARSNAAQVLLWKLHRPSEARKEIRALRSIFEKSNDPKARRRAKTLWASFAADTDEGIGRAYQLISAISEQEVQSMDYNEQRDFYNTRARLSGLMLRFRQAQSDFAQLERLAKKQGAGAAQTQALAMLDAEIVRLRFLRLYPDELPHLQVESEKSLLRTIDFALNNDRLDYATIALDLLATLLSSSPTRRKDALRANQRCLELSQDDPRLASIFALCTATKSRFLAEKDPQQAFALAKQAVGSLEKRGPQEYALVAWRNFMRRAWRVQPIEKALETADSALSKLEGLRSNQRDMTARQLMFSLWTQDYYWLASRLFELSEKDAAYLPKALRILEQSRARVLLEYMPDPKRGEAQTRPQDPAGSPAKTSENFVSLSSIQEQLKPNEAMLVFQVANEQSLEGEGIGGSWVLAISKMNARPIRLEISRSELTTAVAIVRDLARLEDPAIHIALEGLRSKLMDPASTHLSAAIENLIIVADGPLHALPFFSIDANYSYTLAPSATIWSLTRSPQLETPLAPSGISLVDPKRKIAHRSPQTSEDSPKQGDPAFRGPEQYLPLVEARREAEAIRKSLSSRIQSLTGTQATTPALLKEWRSSHNLLHISAHSDIDVETPERSRILLSNIGGEQQGDLRVSDIYTLDLKNDVVVLAGCSTGWGNWIAGEGILSLARAFQIAGASAVVASLWPIRDGEAAHFFEEFYSNLGQGQPLARALSNAQNKLRSLGYAPQAYEGYVVIGNGNIRFEADPRPLWTRFLSVLVAVLGLVGVIRVYRRFAAQRS